MTTRAKIDHLYRLWDRLREAVYLDKLRIAQEAIGVAIEIQRDLDRRLTNLERQNGVREHDGG